MLRKAITLITLLVGLPALGIIFDDNQRDDKTVFRKCVNGCPNYVTQVSYDEAQRLNQQMRSLFPSFVDSGFVSSSYSYITGEYKVKSSREDIIPSNILDKCIEGARFKEKGFSLII